MGKGGVPGAAADIAGAVAKASKMADEILAAKAAGKLEEAMKAKQAPMTSPQGTGLPLMPRSQGMYTPGVPQVDLPQVKDGLLRILHVHRNVPGVLGTMHTLLAKAGINIHAEFLQSDSDTSFVILDVDPFGDATLLDGLGAMPETIRMRIAR